LYRFGRPKLEPSARWALLALLVGLVVGLFCIAFEITTQAIRIELLTQFAGAPSGDAAGEASLFEQELLDESAGSAPVTFSPWKMLAIITLGGLLSGVLVYSLAPEAAGAGTDAAVDAFHNRKGIIQSRIPWVKTLASAITLGTGGSGGREGPIAQIGAGVGAWFGQRLNLSSRDRRILLAAGMGAGVGAMFRAPLAGAIFAAEILYSDADMEADVIVPAAIASIVAYNVYIQSLPAEVRFQPIFGGELSHLLESPWELIPYVMLGVVMLFLAATYVRTFHLFQSLFARLPVWPHLRPAIGAGLAGVVGLGAYALCNQTQWPALEQRLRQVGLSSENSQQVLGALGTGYGTLQAALTGGSVTLGVLVVVGLLKIITTSLTIGSGGSGGVFGPSMVIGGCLGAAFGQLGHWVAPQWVPHPEAYAVVGMAGFFSGVARAPISTIIMVRELTGDFALIVPTMLVSALTFLVSRRWTLYRKQVPTRMESPAHRGDFLVDVLDGLSVGDVYERERKLTLVSESASLDEIVHGLAGSNQHYFPVIDTEGKMVGIFSDNDVRAYLFDSTLWRLANAGDVMTSEFVQVSPSESLNLAMQKFTTQNLDELPVIDPDEPGILLGFLRRKETIAAYNRRLMEHHRDAE